MQSAAEKVTYSDKKRNKVHRKFPNYYEYVENVVNKCSHASVILESKTFRSYKFAKFSNVNVLLPPGKHIKIVPARCKSYSCPICGRKKVYDLLSRLHAQDLKGYRFFTLTLKNKKTLADTEYNINRINECFNKLNLALRKKAAFKNLEYFRVTEIGKDGMVHLHGIWNKYVPSAMLSNMWLQITGDSYIVKPQRVKTKGDALRYLFKYLSKDIASDAITTDPALFNLDLQNTAAIFYENGRRRYQASRKFFAKAVKKENDFVPYYYTASEPREIESVIKYLVKEFNLKENNFDLSNYYESEQFLLHLFSQPPPKPT